MKHLYKLLIADDEQNILDGMRYLIDWENYGFSIAATVLDGEEALKVVESEKIDVILTDIRMLNMDGLDLAKEISEHEKFIPVVIMSAFRDFEYARKSIEYGVKTYLLKPIDDQKLINTLQAIYKDLEKQQTNLVEQAQNQLFHIIQTGSNETEDEVLCLCKNAGIPSNQMNYRCLVINGEQKELSPYLYETDLFLKQFEKGCLLNQSKLDCTFLIYSKEDILNEIENILQKSSACWYACAGKKIEELGALHFSYITAKNILLFQQNKDNNKIQRCEEFVKQLTSEKNNIVWNYQDLLQAVKYGPKEEINYQIEKFKTWFRKKGLTLQDASGQMIAFFEGLVALSDNEIEITKLMMKCRTIDEFLEQLRRLSYEIYDNQKNIKHSAVSILVQNVKSYIENNYADGSLSIKSMANALGYNSSYLGRIFIMLEGLTIKEYIAFYRIEQAKMLIRKTDEKIINIACDVGINDINKFYKLFKIHTQETPAEYRKK